MDHYPPIKPTKINGNDKKPIMAKLWRNMIFNSCIIFCYKKIPLFNKFPIFGHLSSHWTNLTEEQSMNMYKKLENFSIIN